MTRKIEDMYSPLPNRLALKTLDYRHGLNKLSGTAVHTFNGPPEFTGVILGHFFGRKGIFLPASSNSCRAFFLSLSRIHDDKESPATPAASSKARFSPEVNRTWMVSDLSFPMKTNVVHFELHVKIFLDM